MFCVLFQQCEIHECKKCCFGSRFSCCLFHFYRFSVFSFESLFLVKHQTTCFIVHFMLYNIQMRGRGNFFISLSKYIFNECERGGGGSVVGGRKVDAFYYLLHLICWANPITFPLLASFIGHQRRFCAKLLFCVASRASLLNLSGDSFFDGEILKRCLGFHLTYENKK